MDLTRLEINRRTALLTSAAIAANVVNPMRAFAQETPKLSEPETFSASGSKACPKLLSLAQTATSQRRHFHSKNETDSQGACGLSEFVFRSGTYDADA